MAIKTLHLTNAWSEVSGGVATFYRALLEAANRRCRPIRLVVPGSQDAVEDVGPFGRIYHVSAPTAPLNSAYRTIYPDRFFFARSRVQEILAAERPDLVEINDKYTLNYLGPVLRLGLAPALDFRPVVVGLTCERMDRNFAAYINAAALGRAFCRAYMRWVYFPFFDHHIAVSRHTASELREASHGHIVPRGVWVVPMGVDEKRFTPSRRNPSVRHELIAATGGSEQGRLLLYAGRLAPEKNLSLLLDTLEQLRNDAVDFRLLIAGDGISRAEFHEAAQQRTPGRITFLGHVSDRDRLADIFANCDFFLHCNTSEPFGIAVLEAMASGLVVIAPASGGVLEFASVRNAFLVQPTGNEFAGAIRRMLGAPELYRRLSAEARSTAETFAWERVTDAYLDAYHRIWEAGTGRIALQDAGAVFVSSAPSAVRRTVLSASATLARKLFGAAVGLRGATRQTTAVADSIRRAP
jgi:alpha-1,6-mannosyltransferase